MEKNVKNSANWDIYGNAFPIKNAGRPKGSKNNAKKSPKLNRHLQDEIYKRRWRGVLQGHLIGAKSSSASSSGGGYDAIL